MPDDLKPCHTPGPWEWDAGIVPPDGPGRYADIYVLDEDREPIILAEFNDNIPEGRANARLIAAAPELLEALRDLCRWKAFSHPDAADAFTRARAAIAKAEGRDAG